MKSKRNKKTKGSMGNMSVMPIKPFFLDDEIEYNDEFIKNL